MNTLKINIRSLLAPVLLLAAALPSGVAQTIYTAYHFTTIAGSSGNSGTSDGAGSAARFYQPNSLAVDNSGIIYVADTGNQTVRKITPTHANGSTTWTVTTLAGDPGVSGAATGTGGAALFTAPSGLYLSGGLIYMLTTYPGPVFKQEYVRSITPAGVVTDSTASYPPNPANFGPNGYFYKPIANGTGLGGNNPMGYPNEILEYNSVGVLLNTIVGTLQVASIDGPMGTSSADDIGTNAGGFVTSTDYAQIAVDSASNVYFVECITDLIRKVTPTVSNGVESWNTTTVGGVLSSPGGSDGTGAAAHFNSPAGIAVDTNGNVYVADTLNNTIRMGVPDTGPVAVNGTANAVVSQSVTFALPATDPFGDSMTFAITGTTGGTATLSGSQVTFTPAGAGTGTVTYTASDGYVTSSPGIVTITSIPSTPVISQAAVSQTIGTGRSAAFNAQATGYPTPIYQWTLNGSTTIPGASVTNDSILLINAATASNNGTYVCTATNSAGSATTTATLTVQASGNPARLSNLSARAEDLSGGNTLIAGLTLGGSGTEPILVRGVGPTLLQTPFDISNYLPNPVITVYDHHSVPVVSDQGWGNAFTSGSSTLNISPTAATAGLMIQVGAFPITAGSLDSAMEIQIGTGGYTIQLTDANGAAGVGLAEVYDAGDASSPTRLTNISARADVGAGGDILIGGLVITGDSAETVLLRAVGPGLVNQGLPANSGLLSQPVLEVYDGGTEIYSNIGWGGDPVIQSAATLVGATNLLTPDCAVLLTLPPGAYTVLVGGVSGASGVGLVEVFEIY